MNTREIVVFKGGTSVFENEGGVGISQTQTNMMVGYAVEMQDSGLAVALAASGAVPAGRQYCAERGIDHTQLTSPQLARRGTHRQMRHFEIAGDLHGIEVTQNLATHAEIDHEAEGTVIVNEIVTDIQGSALSILNENPTSSNEETKQLDEDEAQKAADDSDKADTNNDWLACHLGIAVRAKCIVLLSNDVDGFEGDDGNVVERITVSQIKKQLADHAREGYKNGSGGIDSKLWAMARAAIALPDSEIIFGSAKRRPLEMMLGDCICTRVVQ